jgi:hypothetical protein
MHALDLGAPLKALHLSQTQTNLLKAIDRRFNAEQQFNAAHRSAQELYLYRFCTTGAATQQRKRHGDEVDTRDVQCAVVVALRGSFHICSSVPGRGRPLRYDWIPARAPWDDLIAHVRREVRKSFEQLKNTRQTSPLNRSPGPSLDAPYFVTEDGDVVTYGEVIGTRDVYPSDGDEPREIAAPRGYSWRSYPGMLRRPSRANWWTEKNDWTGRPVHPALSDDERALIQHQIHGTGTDDMTLREALYDYEMEALRSDPNGTPSKWHRGAAAHAQRLAAERTDRCRGGRSSGAADRGLPLSEVVV